MGLKQGFAKTFFFNTYGRAPWDSEGEKKFEHDWPLLTLLVNQNKLSYLDYVLAHRLLRSCQSASQESALFICHLVLAAKEGHLCIRVEENGLNPSFFQLWRGDEGNPLAEEEAKALTQKALLGAERLPEEIMTVLKSGQASPPPTPLCREGSSFYLQKNWVFETLFINSLKKHLKTPPAIAIDSEAIEKCTTQLCNEKILLEAQGLAIKQGCLHPLTLVTGGPGTGKTYTAGHLIKIFWQNLSVEQRETCQIVLAAPTGKAASNLQRSLGCVASGLEGLPPIQAKTLHSLLGIGQGGSHQPRRLAADLVVVDESSMIDVRVMGSLFASLKAGSRLILLGDKHQLPSVEAGSVFVDLIDLDLNIPSVSLSVCMRAELKGLIEFAELVNEGKAQEVLDLLSPPCASLGIERLYFPADKKSALEKFLSHAARYFPSSVKSGIAPSELMDLFLSIRLLSPVRKGHFGVEELNRLMWEKLSHNTPKSGWIAIPIIVVMNDYSQELFNGETGVLLRRLPLQSASSEDYAWFPSRQGEGPLRRFPAVLLPKYELAYCLSVHKSQGSEFDRVVLVLPEVSELFGREVFYTAITRARKQIEIYGADATILKTVAQKGVRLSGIGQRLGVSE